MTSWLMSQAAKLLLEAQDSDVEEDVLILVAIIEGESALRLFLIVCRKPDPVV
jgi:hypothetical protein